MDQGEESMIKFVAGVAIVAVVLACSDGRKGSPSVNQGENTACHVEALSITTDLPHQSRGTPTDIVGKVRVTCTGAIDSMTIEAKLQREDGGTWVDLPRSPNSTREVARVVADQKYTVQAEILCPADGSTHNYRTGGMGKGVMGGKPAGSATWTYSKGVSVTCK
jgi:hypothetical protein